MSDIEVIFDTASVARELGIQESTLRKYCSLMKKHQYQFHKNQAGHRVFYKKDIEILHQIIKSKNDEDLTLLEAVQRVLDVTDSSNMSDISSVSTTSDVSSATLLSEFELFKKEQAEFNAELLKQLEKQQEYITNSLEKRDRLLMESLKESLEIRKEIASAKSKWKWKFWKK